MESVLESHGPRESLELSQVQILDWKRPSDRERNANRYCVSRAGARPASRTWSRSTRAPTASTARPPTNSRSSGSKQTGTSSGSPPSKPSPSEQRADSSRGTLLRQRRWVAPARAKQGRVLGTMARRARNRAAKVTSRPSALDALAYRHGEARQYTSLR